MLHHHGNPNKIRIIFPLGQFTSAINYLPNVSAESPIYQLDRKWFASHKDRVWVIRKAIAPEFDEFDAVFGLKGSIVFPPQLWVLVTRHPRLGHRVIPCWRGSLGLPVDANGFLTADSDDLIGYQLDVMASSSGIHQPEFSAWHEKWCEAKLLWDQQEKAMSAEQCGKVN